MKFHFAPLQGFTDSTFRQLHHDLYGGVDVYYTPFVRVERGEFRKRDIRELPTEESYTVPQIIGTDKTEEIIMMTDMLVEKGFKEINVNLGCPFPLIVRKGMGSGMLPYPDRVKAMFDVMRKYSDVKWSLKIRLGLESPEEIDSLLPLINDFPFTEVTLHPRVGKAQYAGEIDYDSFGKFLSSCTHPVVYNGDVKSAEDIDMIKSRFPNISGIMIGRGLLERPEFVAEYVNEKKITPQERKSKLKQIMNKMIEISVERMNGDEQALAHIREYWGYLYPEAEKRLRKKVIKANTIAKMKMAMTEFIAEM